MHRQRVRVIKYYPTPSLGATTLSMVTFSIMTLGIMTFSITINKT